MPSLPTSPWIKPRKCLKGYISQEEKLTLSSGSPVSTNTLLNDKAENVVHDSYFEIMTCEIQLNICLIYLYSQHNYVSSVALAKEVNIKGMKHIFCLQKYCNFAT